MRETTLDFVFAMLQNCEEADKVSEVSLLLEKLVSDRFDELCVISVRAACCGDA